MPSPKGPIPEDHYNPIEISMADGVDALVYVCHDDSKRAGWWDGHMEEDGPLAMNVIGTKIALIHSEVSEALEGARKDLADDHLPYRKMVEVELADTMIRICDLAGRLRLDLSGAIIDKLSYNRTRDDHKREVRAKEGGKKV